MNGRRNFIRNTALFASASCLPGYSAFSNNYNEMAQPKISLAQWSLHRALENGQVKAEDFALIARRDYGINAVEYVNGFYRDRGGDEAFWQQMRQRAVDEGVQSLLIMVDEEGDLGDADSVRRSTAVENHYKWIHAAKIMGCHSIRVNAFGSGERPSLKAALVDGLGQLSEYSGNEGIQVLIENHGLHTSDAGFIVGIIQEVGHSSLGTLPDFGNWCLAKEWGSTQNGECESVYDPAKGVAQLLPYAKGVSAKSYAFNSEGFETIINYPRLLGLVKASGYEGFIGVEYEGTTLPEPEGIKATMKLLEMVWKDL